MGSRVSGSRKTNVTSSTPRLEVKEEDRRVEPREDARRAGPRVGARRASPRDEARKARPKQDASRAEPREAAKILSSQTGINANLMEGARGSQTVPTSTPWRIFPSSQGGSSQ